MDIMKKSLLLLLLAAVSGLSAADYSSIEFWKGAKGQAPRAPELKVVETASGKAVTANAVSKGRYQGMELDLAEGVDIEKIDTITFDFGQNVRKNLPGNGAIVLHCDSKQSLVGQFDYGKTEWSKVTVKLNVANFPPLKKRSLLNMGKVVRISFSMFSLMDEPGEFIGVANFKITEIKGVKQAPAAGYANLQYWKASAGQAPNAPDLKNAVIPNVGTAVVATVVAKGRYQGMEIILPEPVDLANVGAITFDFGQNAVPNRKGSGSIIIRYDNRNGLMGVFEFDKTQWSKVRVPIDLRTLKSLAKQSQPTTGKVSKISFSLFSVLDAPGEFIGVANLTFEPKQTASGLIKVNSYRHVAKPTWGDTTGKVLTDGKVEEADQARFRQYADNPDMIFDLGAMYLINKLDVAAVAIPGQNISDYSIYTSKNGKDFQLKGHVKNTDTSTEKKNYTISGKNLNIIGRYIRIKCERSRTDFPLHIAEVSFFGKIPTDAELAAAAQQSYELGPALPAVNNKNFLTVKSGNASVKICRTNGIAVEYTINGKRIAERIFSNYEFNDGSKKIFADSYNNKVKSLSVANNSVTLQMTNPALKDTLIFEKWSWVGSDLARTVKFEYSGSKKYIAYSALNVVLPKDFRAPGVYETWGAGHELQHKFAGEVVFDFPADTGAVAIFENPQTATTLFAYRYLYNDRYLHIGSGTVTVAGFGEKRTIFTANGFRMGDGIWLFDKPGAKGSVTSHLTVTQGDLTAAFDKYLALDEVKRYRSSIKRPDWLKSWRLACGQGWDGFFAKNGQRYVEHMASLIREGYVVYGAGDSDFAWGDFPTDSPVRNLFGGRLSPAELQERDNAIRRSVPNAKISQYTWLWSCSEKSNIYEKHPEWFISKDKKGNQLSFFPGCGVNFYRLVGIKESADEIVSSITRFLDFYNQDIWYLDGGGSPATVDWLNMRLDPPNAWDDVLYRVRTAMQKTNPQRAFFCNHPENPVADFGYLESFGGVLTTNWRDGASWMYKFKLWQRADKLVNPLYIYWLGGSVDKAFRQYAAGTGLGLTFGGSADKRLDAALISLWHQSRWAKLVNANIKPNWRYEPTETFELMPLTFGKSGWLFIKNHENKTAAKNVSLDIDKLGLTDKSRPVYNWCFTLIDHKDHKGLLGEKERESNYRQSRWASDFLLKNEYLGKTAYDQRQSRKFQLKSGELKLWYLTQTPAMVYSVDELRNQIWLDNTLGVCVNGDFDKSGDLALQVESGRKSAEIAALIPENKYVKSVKVNGKAVKFNVAVDANTRLVLIPVAKGKSNIAVTYAAAAGSPRAVYRLNVTAAKPGNTMKLELAPALASAVLVIRNSGDMVWSKQTAAAEIKLPAGITGGKYTALAYDAAGNIIARNEFVLSGGKPQIPRWYFAEHFPQVNNSGNKWASSVTKGSGTAFADPAKRIAGVAAAAMPSTAWARLDAGFECKLQRYVKIRLTGNLWYYNIYGLRSGTRGLHVKWDNPATYLGMVFDFAGADGKYTKRVFAGTGRAQDRYVQTTPQWGANRVPDVITSVSSYAIGTAKEETFWLDLYDLGAPADWTGKTWFGVCWSLVTPDRNFQAQILETGDQLPAGAKLNKIFNVRGGKSTELKKITLPVISGKVKIDAEPNDPAWKKAVELNEFYQLNAAGMQAPPTRIKLMRDQTFLYILAELEEPRESGFYIDMNGKPWFTDGIELYIRNRDSETAFTQYIWSLTGKSHQEWVSKRGAGMPRKPIASADFKVSVKGKKAYIEAAIPLKMYGKGKNSSRFNIGRNRMAGGNLSAYSLAGGREYLNFDVYELIW